MELSNSINHVAPVLLKVYSIAMGGVLVSGLLAMSVPIFSRINQLLGGDPLDPYLFQEAFDRFFYQEIIDRFVTPVGTAARSRSVSRERTEILLHLALVSAVGVMSITFEIAGLVSVASISLMSYHITGHTFNLANMGYTIISVAILLTIAFISYGNHLIQQEMAYV